jgi:hypothetical protein
MSDTEIIELDEPESRPTRARWHAGSLTIFLAPVVVVLAALLSVAFLRPASAPVVEPQRAQPTLILLTSIPLAIPPVVRTPVALAPVLADPEVLEDKHWTALGPAHAARGDVAEAVLNGSVYVIGGTGTSDDGRQVFRYDVTTGTRERAPDLPISIDHAMAATLGDRIYVMGGFIFGQPSTRVFSLGAKDRDWIEHSPLPSPRAAGGAVTLNGRIWLIGGVGVNGAQNREVWMWDGSGRWLFGDSLMPTPRDHLAVGTYKGRICAAGGNGGERAFECYDARLDEWTRLPDLRKPVIGGRAAEAAGWFWVVALDVHVYTVDHWQFGPHLESTRAGEAMAVVNDVIYVIEGATGRAAPMEMLHPQP